MGARSSPGQTRARRAVAVRAHRTYQWPSSGPRHDQEGSPRMGSVIKKRRKRMSKKKHRKLLRKTRVQRRKLGK
ncbi:hypothetical protein GCM10010464_61980 [Pseudonocardia yunnanensis]